MKILREYAEAIKLVLTSPDKAVLKVYSDGEKFLPLSFLCVALPWVILSYIGEGFKNPLSALANWIFISFFAYAILSILRRKYSFSGLLASIGIANFGLIFSAAGIALMSFLPVFREIENASPEIKEQILKQSATSPQVLIPMSFFAFGIVYWFYLTYKSIKEPEKLSTALALIIFIISLIISQKIGAVIGI